MEPNDFNFDLGIEKYNQNDFSAAISYYNAIIMSDPNDAKAWVFRSNVKRDLEDYEGALNDLKQALKLRPDNLIYSYNKKLLEEKIKISQENTTQSEQSIR